MNVMWNVGNFILVLVLLLLLVSTFVKSGTVVKNVDGYDDVDVEESKQQEKKYLYPYIHA